MSYPYLKSLLPVFLTLLFTNAHSQALPRAEEQMAAFDQLQGKMAKGQVKTDEQGNVIGVLLWNHGMFEKRLGKEFPGLNAEDMALFAKFPKLKVLLLEHPGAPAESYAVFSNLTDLEYVNIKNPDWKESEVPADYLVHFDPLQNLRELNLYHNWYRGGEQPAPWDRMQGFPELRRFAGETNLSSGQAIIDLLEHSPKLEFLDLQRSELSDEDLQKLFPLLPEVHIVKWKPAGAFEADQLRFLQAFPKLDYLIIEFKGALPLPFDNGLDHLAPITTLKNLRLHFSDKELENEVEWQKLAEARPDLIISQSTGRILAPADLATDDRQKAAAHVPRYPAYSQILEPVASSTGPQFVGGPTKSSEE